MNSKKSTKKTKFEDGLWKPRGQELKKVFGGGGDFKSKEAFANKIRTTKPIEHNLDDIVALYKTATDKSTQPYNLLTLLDLSRLDDVESFALLAVSIIITADNQFSRFWVKEGLEKYIPKSDGQCPFCQQSITKLTNTDLGHVDILWPAPQEVIFFADFWVLCSIAT